MIENKFYDVYEQSSFKSIVMWGADRLRKRKIESVELRYFRFYDDGRFKIGKREVYPGSNEEERLAGLLEIAERYGKGYSFIRTGLMLCSDELMDKIL